MIEYQIYELTEIAKSAVKADGNFIGGSLRIQDDGKVVLVAEYDNFVFGRPGTGYKKFEKIISLPLKAENPGGK